MAVAIAHATAGLRVRLTRAQMTAGYPERNQLTVNSHPISFGLLDLVLGFALQPSHSSRLRGLLKMTNGFPRCSPGGIRVTEASESKRGW